MGTKSKGRSFLYGLSLVVLLGLTPQTLHAAPVAQAPSPMPYPKSVAQIVGDELTAMEGELEAIKKNPGPDAGAKMEALARKMLNIRLSFGHELRANEGMKDMVERLTQFSHELGVQRLGGQEKADAFITKGLDNMRAELAQIQRSPGENANSRLEVLGEKLNAFSIKTVDAMDKDMLARQAHLLSDIRKAQFGNGQLDRMIQGFEAALGEIQKNKDAPGFGKELENLLIKIQDVRMKTLVMATQEQKDKMDKLSSDVRSSMYD